MISVNFFFFLVIVILILRRTFFYSYVVIDENVPYLFVRICDSQGSLYQSYFQTNEYIQKCFFLVLYLVNKTKYIIFVFTSFVLNGKWLSNKPALLFYLFTTSSLPPLLDFQRNVVPFLLPQRGKYVLINYLGLC